MQWGFISDLDSTTAVILAGLIFLVICAARARRPRNFPPGPSGLPLVGYAPFLGQNAGETFMRMRKRFGPVMSVQIGGEDWVVLNSYDVINEALVKHGDVFSGRPAMFDFISEGYGLITIDYGPVWKNLRKFGLTTLREFGVGKKSMEDNVIEEAPFLLGELTMNRKVSLRTKLTRAVSNIISRIAIGSRFEYDDDNFAELLRIMGIFFSDTLQAKLTGLITMAPALRYLPVFKGVWDKSVKDYEKMLDMLKTIIEERKKTFNENDIRDFTDAFLKEMYERGESDSSFSDKQLVQYIRDLFEAGTGTTSSTLYWCTLCFAHYPTYQEKIAKEIESVIGDSGVPTYQHRDNMPYTCAFIQEIQRHRTLLPLSVFHKTTADCVLQGYNIPKNTTVAPNLWAVHFDPEIFENPTEFRPERFIDSAGKFTKSNHVIPFSIGPRHCVAEQLARMEIFVFLTSIVQKLRVVPDPLKPLPSFFEGGYNMVTYESPDFEVNFEIR